MRLECFLFILLSQLPVIDCASWKGFFGARKKSSFQVEKVARGGSKPYRFSSWADSVDQPVSPDIAEFPVSKDGDGSQEDPDGIPTRYLIAHKQNREKALKAFEKTKEWHDRWNISSILLEKRENFEMCQKIFPVFIPGRDQEGHLIVVQRPGLVNLTKAHEENLSADEILTSYIYMVEYCWNLLDPSPQPPGGLMTTILDCQGVTFGNFRTKEFRAFGKKLVAIMSDHYPTRSYKTLIIHAPKWVKVPFNLVKPLMRESTRKKIKILHSGPEQDAILKELLGGDLPSYLLSENPSEEEDFIEEEPSEIEKEMRLLARVGMKNLKNELYA